MPGGGDECIRNSLVGKMVSMNSKYRGGGGGYYLGCNTCFQSRCLLCWAAWGGGFQRSVNSALMATGLLSSGPGTSPGWGHGWKWILRISCPGIPEDALLCHMKTTPHDPAQLPGATEEIVAAKGVGLAESPPCGGNKGSSAPAGSPPACRTASPTAAASRRGPASNRGNEFLMLQTLHFHHAQISP